MIDFKKKLADLQEIFPNVTLYVEKASKSKSRPSNAFMLFRRNLSYQFIKEGKSLSTREVSKLAAAE